jgi:hypothetical protein
MKRADPQFSLLKNTIAVIEIGLSFPQRFYFCSGKNDAGQVFIIDEVFKIGRTVLYFHDIRLVKAF